MLACNYDVCKNGSVQNYKKDLNCLLVIVRIPTEGNRYNGPLYIITANFDSIMNIVTSYEWFVRYCVRGIDFCYMPFCQLFWPIHVTINENRLKRYHGMGLRFLHWHVPSFYLKKIEKISYGDLWWEWKYLYLTFSSRKTWQFFKHYHLETLSCCLQSKILDLAAYNSTYQ